jgi:mRNA-degrading endonuclease toxin of MazEF toxin-antitoxin module
METENDFNNKDKYPPKKLPIKRGEVFWCCLGMNIGSEQNGAGIDLMRPMLIIKIFSENFFLAAPLTTKKHTGNWYLKISLNDSYVILNKIRPIDIDRFRESMGCISEDELRNIIDSYIQLIKYI